MQIQREAYFLHAQSGPLDYSASITTGGIGAFTIADYIEVLKGSKMELVTESTAIEAVSGPLPSLNASVPGSEKATGSLIFPILGQGTGLKCSTFMTAMKILCGFTQTDYTLVPGLANICGLIIKFSGPRMSGNVLQEAFYNCLADFDIDIAVNKHATATLKVSGAAISEQDTASGTYFKTTDAPSALTYPREAALAPAFKAGTISIGGQTYNVISSKITGNQPIVTYTDCSEPNGVGMSEMADRKIKTTFKVYADPAADTIADHPMVALRTNIVDALTLQWGAGLSKIGFASASHKLTKVAPSDEGGAMTWDIEGECIGNDLTITVGAGS